MTIKWMNINTLANSHVGCLLEIYGDADTGKSSLAAGLSPPYGMVDIFSENLDVVKHRLISSGKEVQFLSIPSIDPKLKQEQAKKKGGEYVSALVEDLLPKALQLGLKRIVIETHPALWQLYQYSEFGTLTPRKAARQYAYAEINVKWRSLLSWLKNNFEITVLVGQTREDYIKGSDGNSTKSGKTIRSGHNDGTFFMNASVRVARSGKDYVMTIEKPWYNAQVRDVPIILSDNHDNNFQYLWGLLTTPPSGN